MNKSRSLQGDILTAVLVGLLLTGIWVFLTWRYGFDVADEGYYWYGAQRMLLGEMPMRDFMAYDVGRYAWSAALMSLLGDEGIFGARMSAALYQACTVVVGVLLVLRSVDGKLSNVSKIIFASAAALLINVWVHPYYKVFDYGTSILIVAMLVLMATSVTSRRWFCAGLILGIAAIMGRNHGVYGAFAVLLLLVFLIVKQIKPARLIKPSFAFVAGVVIGFSPTTLMAIFIDGFGGGFIASIRDLIGSGATNIGLPIPWPWTIKPGQGLMLSGMEIIKGLAFVAIILLPIAAIIGLGRKRLAEFQTAHTLILCASFAGLAYAHYAYSRADLTHLALSIAPLLLVLLGCGVLIGRAITLSVLVIGVSVLALTPEKPFLAQTLLKKRLDTLSINGTDLRVFPGLRERLDNIESVFVSVSGSRNNFLAIPDSPGVYAICKKKMPIWEIYSLSRRDRLFEEPELARLQAASPKVIFLSDRALDERSELRYSRMHPVINQWIVENYQLRPDLSQSTDKFWKIYVRK